MTILNSVYTEISKTLSQLDTFSITTERKEILQQLIDFIQEKVNKEEIVNLNFICTHNSRRSHLSQIWAQVAAAYYNTPNVFCYSGGTEATAMFPKVGETLIGQGLKIDIIAKTDNPIYAVQYSDNNHPLICFSKTYNDSFNPTSGFAAIMTCSSADKGCPFIAGAEKRIPLTFEDPKAFDNTPQQSAMYLERSIQIATEMRYVFSKVTL